MDPGPNMTQPLTKAAEIDVPQVTIDKRVRSRLVVAADDIDDAALEKAALEDEKVKEYIGDKTVKRVIVVSKKAEKQVNIVVG